MRYRWPSVRRVAIALALAVLVVGTGACGSGAEGDRYVPVGPQLSEASATAGATEGVTEGAADGVSDGVSEGAAEGLSVAPTSGAAAAAVPVGKAVAATTAKKTAVRKVAPISSRRSGMLWPSGTFPEPYQAASSADEFGTWRGRPVDVAVVAATRDSWTKMTNSVYLFDKAFFPSSWPGTLVVSMPFWPTKQGNMTACAKGSYDAHFKEFGRQMKATGHGDDVVRLGWEMNGDWWEWSGRDPKAYVGCFRKVATAIRSTSPKVRIDWTVNAYSRDTCAGNAVNCYPGDAYVDFIGIDFYDKYPWSPTASTFARNAALPTSLNRMLAFAKAHGKKLSVSEWGVVSNKGGYARLHGLTGAGGDNAVYIEQMYRWFKAHYRDIAYEAYLETCDKDIEVGSSIHTTKHCAALNPKAGARYRQLW